MAASPCGNHLAREGRLARASAQLLMHSHYLLATFGNCNIVALACRAVNWQRALSYMGTSEPVRAPPEVSRTRGHKLARPRSDRIEVAPFRDLRLDDGSWRQDHGLFFRCQTSALQYSYILGGMFSSCACAMCLRTVSEYWKRSPQMRQCHWSRAKMYGRHSGLFGSSLGLGIFKSCKKNRNHHSGRADYDSGDRAGPG